jgi:predicted dienelactone hydrolase
MNKCSLILVSVLLAALSLPIVSSAQGPGPVDISMFPAPTGPYQVGRITRHWVDASRDEMLTEDTGDNRELVVRIWYPAEAEAGAELALAAEDLSGPGAADLISIFNLDSSDPVTQSFINLRTYAYQDAPVSDEQSTYPVLAFSPGWASVPEDYSIQIEELASHGYIVVSIYHPYYSGATVFPDGQIVMPIQPGRQLDQAPATCAQDILFVLDQLESLNTNDPDGVLNGRLDLERIGVFGSSLGGTAATLSGSLDNRVRAVLNEDGRVPAGYTPLEQPFMLFRATVSPIPSQGPNYTVSVRGFEHNSFGDWPVFVPDVGSIEGQRTVEIVRAFILAFFDKYLKGEDSGLLDGALTDYPEIEIRAQNTG